MEHRPGGMELGLFRNGLETRGGWGSPGMSISVTGLSCGAEVSKGREPTSPRAILDWNGD